MGTPCVGVTKGIGRDFLVAGCGSKRLIPHGAEALFFLSESSNQMDDFCWKFTNPPFAGLADGTHCRYRLVMVWYHTTAATSLHCGKWLYSMYVLYRVSM